MRQHANTRALKDFWKRLYFNNVCSTGALLNYIQGQLKLWLIPFDLLEIIEATIYEFKISLRLTVKEF